MTFFHAVILGIIEGVTEFLPISSTGHMIIANKFLNIASTEFVKSFEIAIQLGAIFSVVVLYWKRVWAAPAIFKKIVAAFIPTAIIGLVFYKIVKTYLLNSQQVVIWSLFIGGLLLIIFEILYKEKEGDESDLTKISYVQSFVVGLAQSIAIIPGVSRSAATIVGGLSLRIKRKTITEFSFLLAVPTMLAATGLDLLKTASSFSGQELYLMAVGFIVSFLTALVVIKGFLKFIQSNSFLVFGIYRVAIAVILLWLT